MKNKWGVTMSPREELIYKFAHGDQQPLLDALHKAGGAVFAEAGSGNVTEDANVPVSGLGISIQVAHMDGELTDKQFDQLDAVMREG